MNKWNFYTTNEIKPQGWLKRQLELQLAGLSGNLDKIWPDVRDSMWIGGTREGWERVPYWLDGFIPLAYLLEDADAIARAKTYVDAILERQAEDGWICPCQPEERAKYDTWAVQLIAKVLTVYYDCSRDERIPGVVYRILKNYYELLKDGTIELFNWAKFRWFECFIAINFTYRHFPEEWLKELAVLLRKQGADYREFTDTWKRPLNKWTFHTHIVNLGMMLKSEAVSADLLGEDYRDDAEALYRVLKEYNGTPVETFTGDECLSGLSPIQGTELCSVVELMYSYEHLFAKTGDNKWAERLEVAAFNALPATISEDMWTHQYVQMSNQIACQKFPGRSLFRTNTEEAHLFGLEPHFGCCTSNFNQGWPKLTLSAFMHNDDTVIAALPIPTTLTTDGYTVSLDTNYPFDNRFTYHVEAARDMTLQMRVPSFAKNLTVDGTAADTVSVAVKAGESRTVTVTFDTEAEFITRPHGLHAVKCGSLLFSLPIAYDKEMFEYERNGVPRKFPYCDYELTPKAPWAFGFADESLAVERRTVAAVPFSESKPPVTVTVNLKPIDWGFEDGFETVCAKVPESRKATADQAAMTLIPYGCAKLRMTELPFAE